MDVVCFSSGETFLDQFQPGEFSLIFLDIYLGSVSGMDIARTIRQHDPHCLLVFVTTSSAHAAESYQVRAFHYLLKPYTKEQFLEVMALFDHHLHQARYIQVKEGRHSFRILLCDIIYADVDRHYIQIHTVNGMSRCRMTFQEFHHLLSGDSHFLTACRNVLVNMDYIAVMEKHDFLLKNGTLIPIQRALLSQARETFSNYLFDQKRH